MPRRISPRRAIRAALAADLRTDGRRARLVGSCGLGRRASGAVEFGYWIARPHWGRGFASEAGRALIAIARALGLTRLEASHFLDNPASGRVLEKLGFQSTGISRRAQRCPRRRDPGALLRLEWPSRRMKTRCWPPEAWRPGECQAAFAPRTFFAGSCP